MLKRTAFIGLCLCLIICAGGCNQRSTTSESNTSAPSSSQPSDLPSAETPPPEDSDTFYPIGPNAAYKWLDGGKLLAVPDGGTIQYIDLDNRLVNTVVIPPDKLIGNYQFSISDNRIFVIGGYDDSGPYNAGNLSMCFTDGEWVLANGSIWDDKGNLLREFLQFREADPEAGADHCGSLSDGRIVQNWEDVSIPEWRVYWLSDDLIVLNGHSRLFFYRLSTDTLTLVDDMSDWMQKYGKMQAYYGIANVMPAGNGIGCYYFAHKNEEKSNAVGTVLYADETGARELFGGQEFSSAVYENGMLVMIDRIDNPAGTQTETTRLWYATDDDLTIRELASWDGSYILERSANGYISLIEWNEPYRFYAIDTVSASVSSYVPQIENCNQYEILGVRKNGGSLQYIYTTFIDGETGYYLYDTQTDTNREMTEKPYLFRDEAFHEPVTHFVERYPNESYDDMFNTTGVRIREIE